MFLMRATKDIALYSGMVDLSYHGDNSAGFEHFEINPLMLMLYSSHWLHKSFFVTCWIKVGRKKNHFCAQFEVVFHFGFESCREICSMEVKQ